MQPFTKWAPRLFCLARARPIVLHHVIRAHRRDERVEEVARDAGRQRQQQRAPRAVAPLQVKAQAASQRAQRAQAREAVLDQQRGQPAPPGARAAQRRPVPARPDQARALSRRFRRAAARHPGAVNSGGRAVHVGWAPVGISMRRHAPCRHIVRSSACTAARVHEVG